MKKEDYIMINASEILELLDKIKYEYGDKKVIELYEKRILELKDPRLSFEFAKRYKGANINYVYLYLCSLLGYDCSDENTKVTKHYHFCIEPLHFKNIFEKRIGFFRCIYHILSSTKCIFNMRDIKPTIKKYKYAIKKRICKHA